MSHSYLNNKNLPCLHLAAGELEAAAWSSTQQAIGITSTNNRLHRQAAMHTPSGAETKQHAKETLHACMSRFFIGSIRIYKRCYLACGFVRTEESTSQPSKPAGSALQQQKHLTWFLPCGAVGSCDVGIVCV